MKNLELKWSRKLLNVLFVIEDDVISYDDFLGGKYDDKLKLHMDIDSVEIMNTFSPSAFAYIQNAITRENEFRKVMFDLAD